jgi:hypothetical protein
MLPLRQQELIIKKLATKAIKQKVNVEFQESK